MGFGSLPTWKYVGGVRVCFNRLHKMSHSFIQNCCRITLQTASFTPSGIKALCQKRKVKLICRGAYWLSGTGIVECLEIVDAGCNLKQLMAWPDWSPYFMTYRRYSGHGPRYMSRFFSKDPRTSLRVADGAEKKKYIFMVAIIQQMAPLKKNSDGMRTSECHSYLTFVSK